MLRFRSYSFLLLLLPILTLTPIKRADACSCLPPPPAMDSLEQASAVFAGKVVKVNPTPSQTNVEPIQVTFEISKVWKGELNKTTIVRTAANSAMCGNYFEIGEKYLVYAYSDGEELMTNLCSRTARLKDAKQDLNDLGTAPKPQQNCSDSIPPILKRIRQIK